MNSRIVVQFFDCFEEWIQYEFQFEGELVQKKVVFFLGETKTKDIKISHEHLNYTWIDYSTAMEKLTFENAKTVLSKSYALLSETL